MNEIEARELLALGESPSTEEIKLAYRRAIKAWHPDGHPPASASHAEAVGTTQLINDAYSVLSGKEVSRDASWSGDARTPWSVAEGRRNNRIEAVAAWGALILMVVVVIIIEVLR